MSQEDLTTGAVPSFEAREVEEQEQARRIYEGMKGILESDDVMALTTIVRDSLYEGGKNADPEAYFKRYEKQNPQMMQRAEKLYGLLRRVNGLSLRDERAEMRAD